MRAFIVTAAIAFVFVVVSLPSQASLKSTGVTINRIELPKVVPVSHDARDHRFFEDGADSVDSMDRAWAGDLDAEPHVAEKTGTPVGVTAVNDRASDDTGA
jgi:hypothetical protein